MAKSRKIGRKDDGGRTLEIAVEQLRLRGFTDGLDPFSDGVRHYTKNQKYRTIYGTPGKMEYWLQSESFVGRLECKFQKDSGSVDEKLPMITRTFEERDWPGCIVLFGGFFWTDKPRGIAAFRWMKSEADRLTADGRRFIVVHIDQFTSFIDKEWPARVTTTYRRSM